MGLTRLQLEDRCLQYGFGELDRARFTDLINMRYRDILGRHRWSWNRTTGTLNLAVNTNSVTLDNDTYIYFGRLRPLTVDVPEPDFLDWDADRKGAFTQKPFDATNRGTPTLYTILTDTIYFNLYADRTISYEANYWPLPTYLTATSSEPVIPDEDREVLVWGALQDQCARDKDWQGMQVFNQMYEGKINEMWAKDRTNNKETILRVQMPSHYYGMFDN